MQQGDAGPGRSDTSAVHYKLGCNTAELIRLLSFHTTQTYHLQLFQNFQGNLWQGRAAWEERLRSRVP